MRILEVVLVEISVVVFVEVFKVVLVEIVVVVLVRICLLSLAICEKIEQYSHSLERSRRSVHRELVLVGTLDLVKEALELA